MHLELKDHLARILLRLSEWEHRVCYYSLFCFSSPTAVRILCGVRVCFIWTSRKNWRPKLQVTWLEFPWMGGGGREIPWIHFRSKRCRIKYNFHKQVERTILSNKLKLTPDLVVANFMYNYIVKYLKTDMWKLQKKSAMPLI